MAGVLRGKGKDTFGDSVNVFTVIVLGVTQACTWSKFMNCTMFT